MATRGVANSDANMGGGARGGKRFSRYRPEGAGKPARRLSNAMSVKDCDSVFSYNTNGQGVEGDDMSIFGYSVVDGTSVLNGGNSVMGESLFDEQSLYHDNTVYGDDQSVMHHGHDNETETELDETSLYHEIHGTQPGSSIPTNICLAGRMSRRQSLNLGDSFTTMNSGMEAFDYDGEALGMNDVSQLMNDQSVNDHHLQHRRSFHDDQEQQVQPAVEQPVPVPTVTHTSKRPARAPARKTSKTSSRRSDCPETDESSFEHSTEDKQPIQVTPAKVTQRAAPTATPRARPSLANTQDTEDNTSNSSLFLSKSLRSNRGSRRRRTSRRSSRRTSQTKDKDKDAKEQKKGGWFSNLFRKKESKSKPKPVDVKPDDGFRSERRASF